MHQVYADHNASTPLCTAAEQAIQAALQAGTGNPSAGHWAGRQARALIDQAREQVAVAFHVQPEQVIFTSGGTESDNHALHALLELQAPRSGLCIAAIEHPAVLETATVLCDSGQAGLHILPALADGTVDVSAVDSDDLAGAALMLANNETGAIQPVQELAQRVHGLGGLLLCDVAQAVGKIPVHMPALGADMLAIAGHKFGAPKGVGALICAPGLQLPPMLFGGGHEGGRRPGTESTLLVAALGAACAALPERVQAMQRVAALRDRFEAAMQERTDVHIHAQGAARLPNTSSMAFVGRYGGDVLAAMPGVAASTGSACHSGVRQLSPVLAAMGVDESIGLGTVRFSFGPENTDADIDHLLQLLNEVLPSVPMLDGAH